MRITNLTQKNKNETSLYQDPFKIFKYDMDTLFNFFARNTIPSSLNLRFDICDKGKEIVIITDVPGLKEKDISINLTNDILTIQGEKKREEKQEKDNYYLLERNHGFFSRSLQLPFQANPKDIEANLDKGVLTITIKKLQEDQEKTHKIEVKKS